MVSTRILIKGAGEHSSGTAHRLFRAGFRVAMTDLAWPKAVRLTVSFCTAIFDREITVEGVRAVACKPDNTAMLATFDWSHIPVFIDPDCRLKDLWRPDVIIDGRILKTNLDNHVGDAPLVIGYGPGLTAGRDVDFVVETSRGHDLGRIITHGPAAADTGVPGPIAGLTHQRVLRSPADGTLQPHRRIGDIIHAGDLIATVSGQPIPDIDPRGDPAYCHTLSDKTRTISGAALEIILSFLNRRQPT